MASPQAMKRKTSQSYHLVHQTFAEHPIVLLCQALLLLTRMVFIASPKNNKYKASHKKALANLAETSGPDVGIQNNFARFTGRKYSSFKLELLDLWF